MKTPVILSVLLASLALAWEGPPPPELDGALRTGIYEITNLLVRNAPASKQNGSAWDPFGGAPDLDIDIYSDNGSSESYECGTIEKENSGTSAIWDAPLILQICGPEDFSGPETQRLIFKVWDSDTSSPDFMDMAEIQIDDMSVDETNTIHGNYGTTISFDIEWVGMQ